MPESKQQTLYGWGHAPLAECRTWRPEKQRELAHFMNQEGPVLARGLGRSYGDSSLQPNGVILTERLNHLIDFDSNRGMVRVQAGVTLKELMDITIPRGWIPAAIPGTCHVTLGGAFACNVHGKNQYREGDFAEHVQSIRLLLPSGESVDCSTTHNREIFWTTAGGMGMTGIIEELTLKLKPISSSSLSSTTYSVETLEDMIGAFEEYRDSSDYMVGWIDHMARGGIRDQLAGGYHRYATSRYWIVPHFEKMLYDNAQLATTHLLAFEATGDPRWRAEAEATFAFIERSMTSPEGAFYSSIDAETRGEEGEYYVWTREQVAEAIGDGPDADMFSQVYGLKRDPNFEKNRYVLLEPRSRADQAGSLKTTPEALEAKLGPLRAKLLAARDQRPAPRRDDKILTAWNGLMIAAYADGYRVLKVDRYRLAAEKGADFLLKNLRTSEGKLLRTYCDGRAKLPAYLEDYAFLAHGLLRLHAATGDSQRLQQARELTDKMVDGFLDKRGGGFFFTADDHESLIARSKDPVDNVLPSGNSVAIRNLVALGKLTGEKRYLDIAGQALNAFSATMLRSPASVPLMLVGLSEYLDARPGPDAPLAEDSVAKPLDSSKYVTATGKVVESKGQPISAGTEIQVAIDIKIADGWHIYANPTGIDEIPPTKLTLEAEAGSATMLDSVTYPEGVAKILASTSKAKVSLHEGTITLLAKVKLDPKLKPGPHALVFNLYCQACNDKSCMSPAKLSVKVPFEAGSPRAGRE